MQEPTLTIAEKIELLKLAQQIYAGSTSKPALLSASHKSGEPQSELGAVIWIYGTLISTVARS